MGVFLGICVKCFQEFSHWHQRLDSGINFYILSKGGHKKKAPVNSLWLHSVEILCPGCEFLFPQASMMFAQCSPRCASSVLLLVLLCCILLPPALGSKVSDLHQIHTEPCVQCHRSKSSGEATGFHNDREC